MKILIIGDSHVEEMIAGHIFTEVDYELTEAWTQKRTGRASKHIYKKYMKFNKNEVEVGLCRDSATAYNISFDLIYDLESYNNSENHCFFLLGTNDTALMDHYPDVDDTTRSYITKILSKLDKTNIHIMYPIKSAFFENQSYHKFCKSLSKTCEKFDLHDPVDMSGVLIDLDFTDTRNFQDQRHLHTNLYVQALNNIIKMVKDGWNGEYT